MAGSTSPAPPVAAIITVGDEIVAGTVANTNARWLARELERLGLRVGLAASLPDERRTLASFVRWAKSAHHVVIVTGGLGATPDDLTRDAVADAFAVRRCLDPELVAELHASGGHSATFAGEWSRLPRGARLLGRTPGGAPAFAIDNVYVLAGLPREMHATFRSIREQLRVDRPRTTWRRTYAITEDRLVPLLAELARAEPAVSIGSYPSYPRTGGARVEIVLRAPGRETVEAAARRLQERLEALGVQESGCLSTPVER